MSFWLDEEIHARIKEYANKSGISVAGAIAILCSYGLDTMATIRTSSELMQNPQFLEYLKTSGMDKDKE